MERKRRTTVRRQKTLPEWHVTFTANIFLAGASNESYIRETMHLLNIISAWYVRKRSSRDEFTRIREADWAKWQQAKTRGKSTRQRGKGEELDISGNKASKFAPGQFTGCLNRKPFPLFPAPLRFINASLDRDGDRGDDFRFSERPSTCTRRIDTSGNIRSEITAGTYSRKQAQSRRPYPVYFRAVQSPHGEAGNKRCAVHSLSGALWNPSHD